MRECFPSSVILKLELSFGGMPQERIKETPNKPSAHTHKKKTNKKLSGVIFCLVQIIPFKQFLTWDAKDEAFLQKREEV